MIFLIFKVLIQSLPYKFFFSFWYQHIFICCPCGDLYASCVQCTVPSPLPTTWNHTSNEHHCRRQRSQTCPHMRSPPFAVSAAPTPHSAAPSRRALYLLSSPRKRRRESQLLLLICSCQCHPWRRPRVRHVRFHSLSSIHGDQLCS